MTEKIRCSVGITAYNEEANIGRLLQAVIDQRLYTVEITEIIVVASGCTDRTEEIVREYMEREAKLCQEINPKIPDEYAHVIAKAMSVDKSKRYQSMGELTEALDKLAI